MPDLHVRRVATWHTVTDEHGNTCRIVPTSKGAESVAVRGEFGPEADDGQRTTYRGTVEAPNLLRQTHAVLVDPLDPHAWRVFDLPAFEITNERNMRVTATSVHPLILFVEAAVAAWRARK